MPAMPAVGSKPSVTLFVPSLQKSSFFGGTTTALVVAAKLAIKSKRQLRIVQTVKTGSSDDLSQCLVAEGIDTSDLNIKVISVADREYNIYGYIPMHPNDIFIASAWWDAHIINQLPVEKFIYLVQDFEPIFYNNSDMYALAEETYRSNKIIPICNTKLMFEFMREKDYPAFQKKTSYYFEPAVSRIDSGKLTKKDPGERKRFFLYGRPNVHRNLFFSALDAINRSIAMGYIDAKQYEFFMAGQNNLPDISLSSGVKIKNLGKMNMKEYIDFSKSIDVALSPMMAPHPNYPTLEFASIGTSVITTKYANKKSLSNYSENIYMSETNAESIANAIKLAASKSYTDKIRSLDNNSILGDWDTSLDNIIDKLLLHFK